MQNSGSTNAHHSRQGSHRRQAGIPSRVRLPAAPLKSGAVPAWTAVISLHLGNPRWVPPRPSYPGADGLHKLVFNRFPDGGQRLDCPAGWPAGLLLAPRVSQQAHPRAPSGPGWLARHCRACPWWTCRPGKNGRSGGPDGEERWQALINPRAASREASCPLTAASELEM